MPPTKCIRRITVTDYIPLDSRMGAALVQSAMQNVTLVLRNPTAQTKYLSQIICVTPSFDEILLFAAWIGQFMSLR